MRRSYTTTRSASIFATAALAAVLAGPSLTARPATGGAEPTAAATAYGQLPLYFEANHGQTDARVEFLARTPGMTVFLTAEEAVLALYAGAPGSATAPSPFETAEPPAPPRRAVVRMTAVGAADAPVVEGLEPLPGRSSYLDLYRRPGRDVVGVPHYGRVRYRELYPGIDLEFYGNPQQLEYDFVVAPGADPRQIELAFDGAEQVTVDGAGALVLTTALGRLEQPPPVIYQQVDGERRQVAGSYRLHAGTPARVGFEVAAYDVSRPLVIDPTVVWAAIFGGTQLDQGTGIAVTDNGQAYVVGNTWSTDFPTQGGVVQPWDLDWPDLYGSDPGADAFLGKFNLAGTQLTWATYIGAEGYQEAAAVALDASRNPHVVGSTRRNGTVGCTGDPDCESDAFVIKLDATASSVMWSQIFGGTMSPGGTNPYNEGGDYATDVALDTTGNVFVSGTTYSLDFPLAGTPYQSALGGSRDAFVVKYNRFGTRLYSTYVGTSGADYGAAIAVDGSGRAYLAGFQHLNNDSDAYVRRLNAAGSALSYNRVFGGSGPDGAFAIAVDPLANAYVTGVTYSTNFTPLVNPFQTQLLGSSDGFVAAINNSGSGFLYASYLGRAGADGGYGIAVKPDSRHAYVTGYHDSDAYVARIASTGAKVFDHTLTGNGYMSGNDVDLDSSGIPYVVGTTNATAVTGVPTTLIGPRGDTDAFVVKVLP